MLVNNPMKFHYDILNDFRVTERTRLKCKFCFFPFQRDITRKICNPELRFLCSARRLMLVNIPVKFHRDISNDFRVTERTRFVTDRRTDDQGKNNMSLTPSGGDIIICEYDDNMCEL